MILNNLQTIGNLDILIMYDMMCLFVSLMWPFGLCYASTLVSTASLQISQNIYNMMWYNFPKELRQCLPLMIIRSQHEILFNGFDIVACTLANFLKVEMRFSFNCIILLMNISAFQINNSACSAYLMFRNVAMRWTAIILI